MGANIQFKKNFFVLDLDIRLIDYSPHAPFWRNSRWQHLSIYRRFSLRSEIDIHSPDNYHHKSILSSWILISMILVPLAYGDYYQGDGYQFLNVMKIL